jgi:DNA-binding CsgD family transcriptional regulator
MIPAGIQQGQTEFFKLKSQVLAMHNGVQMQIAELPTSVLRKIDQAISPKAHAALDMMGIHESMDRRVQFIKCNLGSFDFTPDITEGSDHVQREYVNCIYRGECVFEGLLCQPVIINGNKVTMTELKVTSLIRGGFYDKEICGKLRIAPDTLRSHKRNIQRKLGASRKTEIAVQSIKYGLS